MNLLDIFLNEAPIEDLSMVGNWNNNHSFGAQDRKLLNNPKAQEKIVQKWMNTKVPFNVFLINTPGAKKFISQGEVSQIWIRDELPKVANQIKISQTAINILYTNNTAAERVPLTAWVMAHRFGHSLEKYTNGMFGTSSDRFVARQVPEFTEIRDSMFHYASQILEGAYGFRELPKSEEDHNRMRSRWTRNNPNDTIPYTYEDVNQALKGLYTAIGTMRSAREHEVRTEFEFTLELMAQYMMTGKIKFNPLPKSFRYGNKTAHLVNNEHDQHYYNIALTDLGTDTLPYIFDRLFDKCIGRIFVV